MRAYIRAYVRDDAERGNPLYSPINADLTQFPPCLVITAHFDLLRDEALAFARRIVECGGSVRYRCVEGTIHGFYSKGLPVATAAMKEEIKQFLEMLAAPWFGNGDSLSRKSQPESVRDFDRFGQTLGKSLFMIKSSCFDDLNRFPLRCH
jgi:hypothetical protein